MRGTAVAAMVLAALTACSSGELASSRKPLDTDVIKDAATAIRLGQEACLAAWDIPQARKEPGWKASFRNGVWHFRLQAKACESLSGDLDAATGKQIGNCSICLT